MKAIPSQEILTNNNNNNIINGKITKPNNQSNNKIKNIENEEIQMYLSKLKELVPFMPKNRKLSKLEVIHHVIEYICDLQNALELHPTLDASMVESAAISMLTSTRNIENVNSTTEQTSNSLRIAGNNTRQPLGLLIPNSIVKSTSLTSPTSIISSTSSITSTSSSDVSSSTTLSDKVSSSTDSRQVSV